MNTQNKLKSWFKATISKLISNYNVTTSNLEIVTMRHNFRFFFWFYKKIYLFDGHWLKTTISKSIQATMSRTTSNLEIVTMRHNFNFFNSIKSLFFDVYARVWAIINHIISYAI